MAIIVGQNIRWRLLGKRVIFWLFAELALGVVGLDNLVDCIEYLLTRQRQAAIVQPVHLSTTAITGDSHQGQHPAVQFHL